MTGLEGVLALAEKSTIKKVNAFEEHQKLYFFQNIASYFLKMINSLKWVPNTAIVCIVNYFSISYIL